MQDINVNEVAPVAKAATVYQNGNDEFWNAHVLRAQEFIGSDELYCKQNALSLSTFYDHKRRLGLTKRYRRKQVSAPPIKIQQAFVKLESKPEPTKPPLVNSSPQARVRANASGLPDPKWMAEFVTELLALR